MRRDFEGGGISRCGKISRKYGNSDLKGVHGESVFHQWVQVYVEAECLMQPEYSLDTTRVWGMQVQTYHASMSNCWVFTYGPSLDIVCS